MLRIALSFLLAATSLSGVFAQETEGGPAFRMQLKSPIYFSGEMGEGENESDALGISIQSLDVPIEMTRGEFVSLDMRMLAEVSGGDGSIGVSDLSWSTDDDLPNGVTLQSNGLLSGTPSSSAALGTSDFEVVATHADAEGRQVFSILVNGAVYEFVSVVAGAGTTCGITPDAGVQCWGRNAYGQLGNNSTTDSVAPVDVQGITNAVQVALGAEHACARLSDNTVRCWGSDERGQLGNGTPLASSSTPVTAWISGGSWIGAGGGSTCAVVSSGAARCWGSGVQNALGNNSTADQEAPVLVSGVSNAKEIYIKNGRGCALTNAGGVKCWGWDGQGQVGNNASFVNQPTAVDVSGLTSGVAQLAVGNNTTCAVLSAGGLRCWGSNNNGKLLNGGTVNSGTPVVSNIGFEVASISLDTGTGGESCAIDMSGKVHCWGSNTNPALYAVAGVEGATQISVGQSHACAMTSSGLKCWGADARGVGEFGF